MFLLNDPYLGGTHLNDVKVVRPLFVDGELFCWLASAGHWIDVGGAIPGNLNPRAVDSFQEGSLIPPVRIMDRGVLRDDVVDLVLAQSRLPMGARGDLGGDQRPRSRCPPPARPRRRLRAPDTARGPRRAPRRAAMMTRSFIADLPDGTYSFEDHLDNDGLTDVPLTVALDLTVAGEKMSFDFSRSSPACAGPMNISPSGDGHRDLHRDQARLPGDPRQRRLSRRDRRRRPGRLVPARALAASGQRRE